jgi:hypothetical protein
MRFMNPWCTAALRRSNFARTFWLTLALPLAAQEDQTRQLMERAIQSYEKSSANIRQFLWERSVTRREFTGAGDLKKNEAMTMKREVIDGQPVTHLVQRNGQPLPEAEQQKQQAAITKALAEYRALSPEEKEKRRKAPATGREMEFLREMPAALEYRYVRSDWEGSHEILEFDFGPKPGYKPRNAQAKIFAAVRGKIWVDKQDGEIRRLDAEVFQTVNLGGFLARVEKDTHFFIERTRHTTGAWLPLHQRIRFGARIMMVKQLHQENETKYSGFLPYRESATAN